MIVGLEPIIVGPVQTFYSDPVVVETLAQDAPYPTAAASDAGAFSDGRASSSSAALRVTPQASDAPGFAAAVPAFKPATIYRDDIRRGPLHWSSTAASIINDVAISPIPDRPLAAATYLGRTPAGAWEVTFESERPAEGGVEVLCRGPLPTTTGLSSTANQRPTITVRTSKSPADLRPGDRLSITGRIVEISVDHPSHPGGLIRLEDGEIIK